MSKIELKIGDRKTTVSRKSVREAIVEVYKVDIKPSPKKRKAMIISISLIFGILIFFSLLMYLCDNYPETTFLVAISLSLVFSIFCLYRLILPYIKD